MKIRKNYFSGAWYPADKINCEKEIKKYLLGFKKIPKELKYKIGVVPHAGWAFSGYIAARVIYSLANNSNPDYVILIGGHLAPHDITYVMSNCITETPFGELKINHEISKQFLSQIDYKTEYHNNYEPDNTTELQLPFIKYFYNTNNIILLRIPPNDSAIKIAENIYNTEKNNNYNFSIICSTDLTHYGYRFGLTPKGIGKEALDWVKNKNDKNIIDAALNKNSKSIISQANKNNSSCCGGSLATATKLAELYQLEGYLIDYKTSYDIMPTDISNFVGYAGIVY